MKCCAFFFLFKDSGTVQHGQGQFNSLQFRRLFVFPKMFK